MTRRTGTLLVLALLVGIVFGAGTIVFAADPPAEDDPQGTFEDGGPWQDPTLPTTGESATVEQFESRESFQSYVQRGQGLTGHDVFLTTVRQGVEVTEEMARESGDGGAAGNGNGNGAAGDDGGTDTTTSEPDRISGTNVQEQGIDEPDILKNDGRNVFYAPQGTRHGGWEDKHGGKGDRTHVLSTASPEEPAELSTIDSNGRMVLSGDNLVVIESDRLVGYDVSDPENPDRRWTQTLNSSVVTARLVGGQFYLVTQEGVSLSDPCPIEPLDGAADIACTDVYRPENPTPVDATYSVLAIDPGSGTVDSATSFVGTSERTAVYMSENALYVTYTEPADRGQLRINFLLETQDDQLPEWVTDRLQELRSYDISSQSKLHETNRVLEQWLRTLPQDERHVVRENIHNDYRDFLSDRQRDLVRTGVVRVGVGDGDLSVENVGTVPGQPLNQFSLDEHEGTLRITTTIPQAGGSESRNDLYVLDSESLERVGSVQDMGINERVYSVRYVGETAYVVTFRRIDPFHVVDLSDPSDPEEVGELELPGFSSYLHPIDDDHVLGIGREDGQVKAVTFNVSDPSDPTVEDDYLIQAGWSAIAESHHAFLLDRQHGVFFLPTGEGGHVIDYTDGSLSLETHVDTDGAALRAMYVDDYMYVFGTDEIAVVDETTWERVDTLELD